MGVVEDRNKRKEGSQKVYRDVFYWRRDQLHSKDYAGDWIVWCCSIKSYLRIVVFGNRTGGERKFDLLDLRPENRHYFFNHLKALSAKERCKLIEF
jgi:hypothetical protein